MPGRQHSPSFRLPAWLAAAFVFWLATALCAQPALPHLAPQDGVGVNIHFTHPQSGELEMMAQAGIKWVRMDLTWSETEKQRGKYDFSAYDDLLDALDRQNMHALFILCYGNPLYAGPGDTTPFTSQAGSDEFRNAYAKWAAAAVSHFAHRACIWEIWNEPNISHFWGPSPNVGQYIALAKATAAAVHKVAPDEPLIGPASSTIDFSFIEACCKAGLLEDWSAVSVHPYRQGDPSTVVPEYRQLRKLIDRYAPQGKTIPIICSEWGYSTAWQGFEEDKQATSLTAEFSANISAGIPITIWYDWRDDGDDPGNSEHHFGLVHRAYHTGRTPVYDPKPAYEAIKEFADRMFLQ